jgi:hypothetical protein
MSGRQAPRRGWARAAARIALASGLAATAAMAGSLSPAEQAETRRAVTMVGPTTSEEPAVRQERKVREPTPAFMLGAALGAWVSAAAQLDFDLKTPSGDGDDSEAIAIDCSEERVAFDHLTTRATGLGLTPKAVVEAAGLPAGPLLDAWRAREAGQAKRCR